MKPILKYPGGKSSELPIVRKYKPQEVNRYFEPFVGGGAVYFDMSIPVSYINDRSNDLYYLYTFIKEGNIDFKNYLTEISSNWKNINQIKFDNLGIDEKNFAKFYQSSLKRKNNLITKLENSGKKISEKNKLDLNTTAKKTALYTSLRDLYNSNNLENYRKIAIFYFLREYCYSAMFRFNSKGNFNVPYGGMNYNNKHLESKINYLFSQNVKEYLQNTIISNLDFEDFFASFTFDDNDFIFLDPPYDSEFSTYDKNSFSKNDQLRLRNSLMGIKAKWLLIIKKTDFISNIYQDFFIYEYDKSYNVSFKNRNVRSTKHLLITNYNLRKE